MRRRGGFTVLEVLVALGIALLIMGTIMIMMRVEGQLRGGIDERLSAENTPAVLHRHLSRDLSRVPLVKGEEAVKVGGDALELEVQVAPAALADRKLALPVNTVSYRMGGKGTVLRQEGAQREMLPVDGLLRLSFQREPATGEGQQDMLRVSGAVEGRAGGAPLEFSLAFPVGARKPGRVRWASLIQASR